MKCLKITLLIFPILIIVNCSPSKPSTSFVTISKDCDCSRMEILAKQSDIINNYWLEAVKNEADRGCSLVKFSEIQKYYFILNITTTYSLIEEFIPKSSWDTIYYHSGMETINELIKKKELSLNEFDSITSNLLFDALPSPEGVHFLVSNNFNINFIKENQTAIDYSIKQIFDRQLFFPINGSKDNFYNKISKEDVSYIKAISYLIDCGGNMFEWIENEKELTSFEKKNIVKEKLIQQAEKLGREELTHYLRKNDFPNVKPIFINLLAPTTY